MSYIDFDCQTIAHFDSKILDNLIFYPQEIIRILEHVISLFYTEQFPGETPMSFQIRPYNVGYSLNMRELNPSGKLYYMFNNNF